MSQSPVQLKVLTFNLWGIFNSKMREDRMAHFASKIEHYDIILLQEQFDPNDFAMMQSLVPEHVRKTRYFRRFPSGFYGSGCAVISKFPITSAFFHIYPLQGYPEMVLHGDFFANKGAALVKVAVPVERNGAIVNQEVILYTTHLVAVYQKVSQMSTWKKERYLPYRISQAISLADFIMNTSKPTDYIIIGGDFNSSQRSLEVQMMLILLKRKGYDLRSVLPIPGTLLEQARTEEQAEIARSMFTYSYRNAFNASKTSYFKMLKLEADIPSQIDHIFFNAAAFTLRAFPDCPDASPTSPFEIDVDGSGTKVPSGVVVLSKNEVARSQKPSVLERWADALRLRSHNNPQSPLTRVANALASPKELKCKTAAADCQAPFAADDAHARYPISDHFGVACRLEVHPYPHGATETCTPSDDEHWQHLSPPGAVATVSTSAGTASAIALTEEELLVVNNVEKFLDDFVNKLRHQVKVTRVMAGVSVTIMALNVWCLHRLGCAQEQRTLTALRQLYHLAAKGGRAARDAGVASPAAATESGAAPSESHDNVSATEKVTEWTTKGIAKTLQWTGKALDAVGIHVTVNGTTEKSKNDGASPVAKTRPAVDANGAVGVPDFNLLAKELLVRPLWASLGVSTAVTMVGSIVSVGAFAIGMFQRLGNANILAEQVRLINPSAHTGCA